jgi:arylsulfatase A-like enzyme
MNLPSLLQLALLAFVLHGFHASCFSSERPNIIVIFTDDQGYGDLGCYGSKTIATPRLDRMAAEGMRFTDFYVAAPFCSPSRAALLTGRQPARCGVPYVLFPGEHHGLPPEEITLAELLKSAGYATGMVGKWHLGWRRELRPQKQGFDEYHGLLHTNDPEEWQIGQPFRQLSAFEPLTLREGDRVIERPVDQTFLTEKYTQRSIEFITHHQGRPFFLYLAHTMPHVPQYASPAFEGKSKDGLYGDCIEELDHSTGRILDHLQKLGLAEKTLVLFTSDNGANSKSRMTSAIKAALKPGEINRKLGGSNAPLREGKGSTYEGGIRVPCIAWWPGSITAGRVESTPCNTLDVFPTLAALTGATLPNDVTLDGTDISPLLKNPPAAGSAPRLLTHYFGVQLQAVRQGKWKLFLPIAALPQKRLPSLWFDHQKGLFERQHRLWPQPVLYDLETDPSETTDLAAQHPEVVQRLTKAAQAHDTAFQPHIRNLHALPGPKPPAPGEIRTAAHDLSEWKKLNE